MSLMKISSLWKPKNGKQQTIGTGRTELPVDIIVPAGARFIVQHRKRTGNEDPNKTYPNYDLFLAIDDPQNENQPAGDYPPPDEPPDGFY